MFEDIFEEMKRMQKEMDRLFKEISKVRVENVSSGIDMYEENGNLIIKIDMPGVDKKDINLTVTEDSISVSAKRSEKSVIKKKNFYKAERSYAGYNFYETLPVKVIPESAEAEYKNGVLTIKAKIAEESKKKKSKKVNIK